MIWDTLRLQRSFIFRLRIIHELNPPGVVGLLPEPDKEEGVESVLPDGSHVEFG